MQKRFYILFVARGDDGQLRKVHIPVHYLYVFLVGAAIVGLSLTGIVCSPAFGFAGVGFPVLAMGAFGHAWGA